MSKTFNSLMAGDPYHVIVCDPPVEMDGVVEHLIDVNQEHKLTMVETVDQQLIQHVGYDRIKEMTDSKLVELLSRELGDSDAIEIDHRVAADGRSVAIGAWLYAMNRSVLKKMLSAAYMSGVGYERSRKDG